MGLMHPIKKVYGAIGLSLCVVLAMGTTVANVALARYQGTISSTLSVRKQIAQGGDTKTYQAARKLTAKMASEGTTLLKNENNALPLTTSKVNVFGYASYNLVYGGSGSGSTSGAKYNDNLKQSFAAQGISVNPDLWNYYKDKSQQSSKWNVFSPNGGDYNIYDAKCTDVTTHMAKAKAYSDTALVVFSRAGGEGADLPQDMGVKDEKTGKGLVGGDKGKTYLQLQDAELSLLHNVEKNFKHVVVLINSSHAMELGFVDEAGVDAALDIAGPGATGMRGVAEVLKGDVNPSGHLVDTYAYDVKSAPSYYNMGNNSYSNYTKNMSDKYAYFE
ncbi:glycoside hydrolase family 3 protein [Lacticaseibacillus daqingensis]|uniref:glycoside hydrolase family 3 protein n=1 Tax=Lacticaseibacillus daqingensis TaxID=2486014 RepID=UPI001CDD6B12|nr:glycoside hydrolase family 3 C-terminal domain-containing protein [Lacticaseibacillus daqingensis]